jgi:hypothetical protein
MWTAENQPTFRRNISLASSWYIRLWTWSQTKQDTSMKQAARCSETSVDFQRTTRRYIPDDTSLHNHRGENTGCNKLHGKVCLIRRYCSNFCLSEVESPLVITKVVSSASALQIGLLRLGIFDEDCFYRQNCCMFAKIVLLMDFTLINFPLKFRLTSY